jgi:Cu/Ag efflux pump CusA
MKRIAAPMVGGEITLAIFDLMIYPAIDMLWRDAAERKIKDLSE